MEMNTANTKPTRRIFLVDASGAFLTAVLSGIVLPHFQPFLGMPAKALICLGLVGALYTLYSFTCWYFNVGNWPFFLRIVIVANVVYCCLLLGLILFFYDRLTRFGLIYFLLEIVVIITLALIETRILSKRTR